LRAADIKDVGPCSIDQGIRPIQLDKLDGLKFTASINMVIVLAGSRVEGSDRCMFHLVHLGYNITPKKPSVKE